jgi:hypothetical protein
MGLQLLLVLETMAEVRVFQVWSLGEMFCLFQEVRKLPGLSQDSGLL